MEPFKLIRTKQCAKCPWKVSTNPFDIPDGYCPSKHRNLKETIATDPLSSALNKNPVAMACHHSDGNDQMFCVGWLYNQMGEGNNIGLRLRMRNCTNIGEIKVYGKQHSKFEDTLPKE